ncbi:hypothetical protein [Sporisorium scitamineum]|uniref:Uncharacterized protein n=1 Tax=Sporisorium scitamineum TaxID=49012 RepID=A0A0F7RWR3_9BASI|nr:hypothetical protein [Sporisorium scitamineum]
MSKPIPQAWRRGSGLSESPSFSPNEFPAGVETPLATSDNEDGMAYLRSMSYVHTSGRFSSYSTLPADDSRRGSAHNTLVNASNAPTDYASSDNDSTHKAGKFDSALGKSPLRASNSWGAQAEYGGVEVAEMNPEAVRKMKYGRLRGGGGEEYFVPV